MQRIALLGVGKMGRALAERWILAGHELVLWNRSPLPTDDLTESAQVSPTVAQAVAHADVVVTMLTNGEALRSVLIDQGAIEAMQPGATLIDLSTVDVPSSEVVAHAAATRGVPFVRGAVSGTPAVIRSGGASLLLSGDPEATRALHDVLTDVSPRQTFLGPGEEARVVKIAVNSMLGGTTQLLAEATTLAEASGVSRESFLAALAETVIASKFTTYKTEALLARNYSATFTTRDMRKDMSLACEQAERVGVHMVVAQQVLAQLDAAVELGFANDDFLTLNCLVQAQSGLPVDKEPSP